MDISFESPCLMENFQGNYAFLMESTMLDYVVQRDCNLTQIGGLLGLSLGFSLISGVEIMYYLLVRCWKPNNRVIHVT